MTYLPDSTQNLGKDTFSLYLTLSRIMSTSLKAHISRLTPSPADLSKTRPIAR
jgi:hypothetical protein